MLDDFSQMLRLHPELWAAGAWMFYSTLGQVASALVAALPQGEPGSALDIFRTMLNKLALNVGSAKNEAAAKVKAEIEKK